MRFLRRCRSAVSGGKTGARPKGLSKARPLTTAFILVTGLIVSGSVGMPASASALPSAQTIERGWSSVPEYSTAPALASGEVVESDGTPVSQSTVILFPVPLSPKSGTPLTPLARTITDSQGRFTIRLPVGQFSKLATSRSGGALNLHVIAFYPGGIAQQFYSVSSSSAALLSGDKTADNASPTFAKLILHATLPTRFPGTREAAISPDSCEPDGSATQIPNVPVIVGMKESEASDLSSTTFSYSSTASMTLGVGISYTSPTGGFSADGSTTQTSGGSYTWDSLPSESNNDLEGYGIYNDQEFLCIIAGNYSNYWLLSQNYVGGEYGTPGTPPVAAGDCIPTQAHTTNTFTTGTQQTFGAGVQLSGLGYGINLSSQSGFSTDTSLTYEMGAHGHPVCGVSVPPGDSGKVEAIQVHSGITT